MTEVFVYGTLLKGMSRFSVLSDCVFLGPASTVATLYDLGSYPAILEGDGTVYGELYEAPQDMIRELDHIEGYHQDDPKRSLYVRKEIRVTLLSDGSGNRAFAYFFNGSVDLGKRIECSDYRRFQLEALHKDQWYIAYGSNMSVERLEKRIGSPLEVRTGYLDGHELRFNKQGQAGGSYANIAWVGEGSRCPFAAYLISKKQLFKLDRYEGEPAHYVRIGMPFTTLNGEKLLGHIYVANLERLTLEENPSPEYVQHIRRGYEEHGFDARELPM